MFVVIVVVIVAVVVAVDGDALVVVRNVLIDVALLVVLQVTDKSSQVNLMGVFE